MDTKVEEPRMSKRNDPDAILRLERQVERGCLFNHSYSARYIKGF